MSKKLDPCNISNNSYTSDAPNQQFMVHRIDISFFAKCLKTEPAEVFPWAMAARTEASAQ